MNIDLITEAKIRLEGHARLTPLLSSPFLDDIAGKRLLIKPECLQRTGSFKFRGAWSAISQLEPAIGEQGVIAFSSGNHAQGVALAAAKHGYPAVIIMPSDAPALKIENTRALGAEVVLYDRATQDRDAIGDQLAQQRGLTLIKPFDNEYVIAGQATVGVEIADQTAQLGITEAEVLVPCGGGGLTSGIAVALAHLSPGLTVRPVEPQGFDDVTRSLRSGSLESNSSTVGSICDAIITPHAGALTFPLLIKYCGSGIVISDQEALCAMGQAFLRLKLVAEPGGAAALAAALYQSQQVEAETVVVVISGGNVDPTMFREALKTVG